ncbi:MAG: hypothetical protein ACPHL9_07295, partial [Limisphaerales bacterium]
MNMFLKTGALGLALAGLAQTGLAKELNLDDLFPRDRLLEINVTIPEEDWDTLRYQRRTRENALPPSRKFQPPPSPYTYVEADVTIEGVTYKKVGI